MEPRFPRRIGGLVLVAVGTAALLLGSVPAGAAEAPVGLGTASSFAVLAGSQVTNTGPSVINGDLGVSPGTAITGFPPGIVNGTIHSANATTLQAQADTTTAYNDAAGRTPFTAVATELGGTTLTPGVYRNTTLGLTGTLTLDAQGDPNAVFVFQAGSTLITASASRVNVINGGQACNVFWQVGSSATLATTTRFVGTVLAQTSITANNGATVQGRLLARTGAVTLDNNTITASACAAAVVTTTTTTSTTTTSTTAVPATTTVPPASTTPPAADDPPTGPITGTGTGVAVPADGTGTPGAPGAPRASGPNTPGAPGGGGGGGDSSTGLSRLPRTGFELTALAVAGGLAIVLGATMLRRSRPPRGRHAA